MMNNKSREIIEKLAKNSEFDQANQYLSNYKELFQDKYFREKRQEIKKI